MAHVQLSVQQVLFCKAGAGPWGRSSPDTGDFASAHAELHEAPVGLFLQSFQVPLNGSRTLWSISPSLQFGIVHRLNEGALCPIFKTISDHIKTVLEPV